uniref:Transcription initiation factor TFIID subunit 2 n=1 Tax=Kwoniella dejecticola CBS 10117 TaxID=1296121 RepID=A0A1A5ZXF8_9TREE|nr:transcription initiation factor TFIID subunit 2 [Kwoniella dejecticola CBS 10117]OBR82488.1 transcription initiation factor TFIID subunit 2 [Kwoniella dejecticola CBS 10117]
MAVEEVYPPSRGFVLTHQRNVLDIDFQGIITASAFLTIEPTNPALRTIYLNASPLLQINNVTLSSPTPLEAFLPTPVSFTLSNPFQPLPVREPPIDLKSHPEIKRKTWSAMGESDEGELAINVSGGWVRLVETQTSNFAFAPIQVQIDYQLVLGGDIVEGIVFKRPGDAGNEFQIPHMYLSPTTYDAARIWTPCVDSLWERCTWELEFIVPRYLEGGEPGPDEEAYPVMVVSSGELMEQVTHPHDPNKVIFYYLQTNPTSVQHISFAAGPFEMHCCSADESHKPILAFCLPGELDNLKHSTSWLPRAMTFYAEMGSYPFTDFKAVFVNNPRTECSTSATLAILSSDLLHPPTIIEEALEIRQILSLALIQQWVGVNIIQRTLADTWLINGLALYIQAQFIRHLLGNNEYRFRMKKDIDKCVQQDQGSQWPLCVPGIIDPPDANTTAFINLKAPLVLHILDRYIAKTGTSLGLSQVIPRIFVASLSDELQGNSLSTQYFFRQCRKVSGLDLQTFQDQWIFGSGCPKLSIRTNFIKKKLIVEFTVNQSQPAHEYIQSLGEKARKTAVWRRPTRFFEGSLTVRIHEADGAPFEHLVDIKTPSKTFPLPFNTKYKRTRRSGHIAARFSKMQDALADEAANDEEDEARLQAADRAGVFAYPPWEDEEECRRWRVAEWGENDADALMLENGGYEWIRIDPECEWLASIEYNEKPWCWISQLQGDRDVVAQLEAINRMRAYPSPVIASELARTVLVKNYYYRVRMEAARALAVYNVSECDYIGYFLVLKLFQTLYCHPPSDPDAEAPDMECRPLPNDFSNFSDYFVKKSLIATMPDLRDMATRTVWKNVRVILLDLLKLNDNTGNAYSDSYYLAAVITAIGNAFTFGSTQQSLNEDEREAEMALLRESTDALDRVMTMDRLVPSHHNLITKAGLQTHIKSILAGQRTNDARLLLSYTREGNFEPIRLVAFDGLLLCKPPGRSLAVDRYLIDVIRADNSLTIRRHVARGLSESILMTLALGEIQVPQPGVVEDENDDAKEKRLEAQNTAIVKAVRKDFSKRLDIKSILQDALIFTLPDHEVRMALLKAAEVISGSTTEPLPGTMITLQTPTVESAPPLPTPKIRLSMGSSEIRPDAQGYGFPVLDGQSITPTAATTPLRITLNANGNFQQPTQKKKEKVLKQQKNGLSDNDFKAIAIALQKLIGHKSSHWFRQPVDAVRDNAADYAAIIKHPMDLQTISAKLDNGMYTNRQEFVVDVKLIISNCYSYNVSPASPVRKAGEAFEKMFNNLWTKTEHTLSSSAAAAQQAALAPKALPAARSTALPAPSAVEATLPAPKSTAVKFKVKPPKNVTIDTSVTEHVPPMAPPPLPSSKKATPSSTKSPDRPPVPTFPTSEAAKPSKKRKEPSRSRNELDDILGAEIDEIEKRRPSLNDGLSDLLPSKSESPKPPAAKKIKIPNPSTSTSTSTSASYQPRTKSPEKPASALIDIKPKIKFSTPASSHTPTPPPSSNQSLPSAAETKSNVKKAKLKGLSVTIPPEGKKASSIERSTASPAPSRSSVPPPAKIQSHKNTSTHPQPHSQSQPQPPVGDAIAYVPTRQGPPPDLPPTVQNTAPMKNKRAKGLITALSKDIQAVFFLKPVDPIVDGCPTYFQEIKHPMDFETITKKIDNKKYKNLGQFARDVELVFANCRQFNPPGEITQCADHVEALYWKEWPKVASSKMTPDERKAMGSLIAQALKSHLSEWFRTAVDPIALGIPQYFDIIPPEDARDLTLIKGKFDKGQYREAKHIDEDVELMLENARVFNGDGPVVEAANALGKWWTQQRMKMD